ncbi:cellulose signaling related protein ooc1 [Grosmannia clavigera kw1407]|uniref:Cellulose signaling related protein ooc1 n=1 Tax=Grosmannia clavigera (strain kw1407 / UAMH 11150) TaxID=655863 RepID=F0XDM0_GROCL|nr:cellulose signaling related protein ooc1 [Grosmannia clavigera kw1407]EFX03502.1 cellulose signaling related protein ooc1 [Grosmannia clavigera kw1407]
MMFQQTVFGLAAAALMALIHPTAAFTTACEYQEYKCGQTLFTSDGYNITEFETAVNATGTIPPLADSQLLNVLYRCIDVEGGLVGNSYCISGCITMGDLENDQCAM